MNHDQSFNSTARVLTEKRWALAIASVLVIVLAALGLPKLQFESSYKIFFSPENPQLMAQDLLERTYTKDDSVMFVFELADGKVFTPDTLSMLRSFTDEAWQIPYSLRVDSLTNYQYSRGEADDLIVEDFITDDVLEADEDREAELARKQTLALSEPQLVHNLVSDKAHTTAVLVTLQLPDVQADADEATAEVVSYARELAGKYEAAHKGLKVHMIGQTIVNATFVEMSSYDSMVLIPIMLLVIVGFLVLLLKSFMGMLATLVIIISSVVFTQGVTGWIGYSLNQVNVASPIIILTLAVCDCVHILNTYFHQLAEGDRKLAAMKESLRVNLKPVILTSVTTAVGFASMNFSDSPPFRELGNIAAIGVMAACVLSLTLFPALMVLLPIGKAARTEGRFKLSRFVPNLLRFENLYFYGSLAVAGILIVFLFKNELNDDTIAYFHEEVPFRQAADFTQANLTGFDTISYSLDSGSESGISDPAFQAKVDAFAEWYLAQPEVVHVSVFTDVIKRLNKNLHADDEAYYRLPESKELASQYLLLYEMSLPYGLDLNNQINVDKSALKMTVRIKDQKAQELINIEERAQGWLDKNAPELKTPGASISIMFAHIGQRNINSMLIGSLMALVLVTLTLMLALKSVKYGLISLLPNAFPAAIAFGIWGIFVGEVNLAVAVIFAITLGIVVDDTVHFITKYLRGVREHHLKAEQAIGYAFDIVGKALIITTVVLAAGFFVLSQSSFAVNSSMGLMVSMTIIIALIWDFIFLPILLVKLDRGQRITATEQELPESLGANRSAV
ncbi:efflux RND transporter permease subunit [Allohahella sp. A8]|uniref:efflux RND transporter permease subunit n=1 Tax=Allohahella sp. A8 TaxID=3141461 RepID=UPI000C0AA09C|nr:RND transporter [Hahellaceae bacterium]